MTEEPTKTAGKTAKTAAPETKDRRRVWCCYDKPLGENFILFGSELTAMRYAVEHTMFCRPVDFGVAIQEQLK
jgi:hypothetical protein